MSDRSENLSRAIEAMPITLGDGVQIRFNPDADRVDMVVEAENVCLFITLDPNAISELRLRLTTISNYLTALYEPEQL